jgi:low affinity Fe/Cu permease
MEQLPRGAAGRARKRSTGAPATPTIAPHIAPPADRAGRSSRSVVDRFNRAADAVTIALGSLPALVGSVLIVVIWAVSGPLFGYSDSWQLFINTTTTVVTFWMVFVIQNSANRASKATQLKLDELIRSISEARNAFIALDQQPVAVLEEREREFTKLATKEEPDVAG